MLFKDGNRIFFKKLFIYLFVNRLLDLFDVKQRGSIDFLDSVQALKVIHPNAAHEDEVDFALRIYHPDGTWFIEWKMLKQMLIALPGKFGMRLSDKAIETIWHKTFWEADAYQD